MKASSSSLLRPRRVAPILRPLVRFLQTEAAGGVVLLACTVVALAAAASPWAKQYAAFWHTHLSISVGTWTLDRPLEWWVNDGLMTLFFFVVGLEIKRELISGELRDPRKAALPAAAALGGMVVPALIYFMLQRGSVGERGWGIPMATDIAFVVGVLALLGPRVPAGLKIMLLSLAIVDDLGAVLVIAFAYTAGLDLAALGLAALGLAAVLGIRFVGLRAIWVYVVLGALIWLAMVASGVHPTIAGVALGLMTPAREELGKAALTDLLESVLVRMKADPSDDSLKGLNDEMVAVVEHTQSALSPLDRLERALHPWVAFAIMPLFALANAGVAFKPDLLAAPVAVAVALGLLIGKPVGIVLFSWLSVKAGVARLPSGVNLPMLIGAGCLGGIGFTMSLFITALAFDKNATLLDTAKVGTLAGSLVSAALGSTLLLFALPRRSADALETGELGASATDGKALPRLAPPSGH